MFSWLSGINYFRDIKNYIFKDLYECRMFKFKELGFLDLYGIYVVCLFF